MSKGLEPVPCRCGGESHVDHIYRDELTELGTVVERPIYGCFCVKCGIRLPFKHVSEAAAVKEWNTIMGNPNVQECAKDARWIPVSERLPGDDQSVMCTIEGPYETGNWVFPECRYKDGIWETLTEANYDYWETIDGVIAWMPYPEPYGGE